MLELAILRCMIQRQISQMVTSKTSLEQSKQYGQNNPQQPHPYDGSGYGTGIYLEKILKDVKEYFLIFPARSLFLYPIFFQFEL